MRKNISSVIAICGILIASFSPLFASAARAQSPSNPDSVNIPGTHQDELGCPGEWQPDCENTMLAYDEEDDVWQGLEKKGAIITIPYGSDPIRGCPKRVKRLLKERT